MANTLADFLPDRFSISAYCDDCEHNAQVPVDQLPASMTVARLRAGLRCSECGSRQTQIIISYCACGLREWGKGQSKSLASRKPA